MSLSVSLSLKPIESILCYLYMHGYMMTYWSNGYILEKTNCSEPSNNQLPIVSQVEMILLEPSALSMVQFGVEVILCIPSQLL